MPARFRVNDVVDYLDTCIIDEPYCFFMDLQHGYFHTANSRLTLYADAERWVIVFEKNGYANRGRRIELELNFFGNCLQNLDRAGADDRYVCNAKWITLVDHDALGEIEGEFEQVSPRATSVAVRDERVPIPSGKDGYAKWIADICADNGGLEGGFGERPTFADLGRFLAFEHADLCRAAETEKRQCLPTGLREVMVVNEWHHRGYSQYVNGPDNELMGDAPSTYETFPLLAEVLVTGDPSRFRPTLPPNNHWSNWPEAGQL
jgi:hypothetical protein